MCVGFLHVSQCLSVFINIHTCRQLFLYVQTRIPILTPCHFHPPPPSSLLLDPSLLSLFSYLHLCFFTPPKTHTGAISTAFAPALTLLAISSLQSTQPPHDSTVSPTKSCASTVFQKSERASLLLVLASVVALGCVAVLAPPLAARSVFIGALIALHVSCVCSSGRGWTYILLI